MKIEYDFFTQAQERIRQYEEKISIEEKRMTEKEREEERLRMKKEADEIIRQVEQIHQMTRYVPNKKRIQEFSQLYKKAICFAKYMDCNIVIESDMEKRGKILLYSENFLFEEFTLKEMRMFFIELMNSAESIQYTAEGNLIKLELIYKLADMVYMKSLQETEES